MKQFCLIDSISVFDDGGKHVPCKYLARPCAASFLL